MRPHVSKVRAYLTTAQAGDGYIWGAICERALHL